MIARFRFEASQKASTDQVDAVAMSFETGLHDEQTHFGKRIGELEIGRFGGLISIDHMELRRHDPAVRAELASARIRGRRLPLEPSRYPGSRE